MTAIETPTVRRSTTLTGALHVIELNLMRFRRLWRTAFLTSFLQPLMYLAGMGVGVGTLVHRNGGDSRVLGGVGYASFIAPGLLVTTAMFVAANEATWPILGGFKWQRTFIAQATTPIAMPSILLGLLGWFTLRMGLAATAVALAMCGFHATRSIGLPVAVLAAVLTGLALAAPTMAYSASKENDGGFVGYHRFLIMPMFLFGGAFYPVTSLPVLLRPIARLTPLWHGVELARAATLHHWRWGPAVGHTGYLVVWIAVGVRLAMVAFARKLEQ